MARRRQELWEEVFEALRWLFSVVHPGWSIPAAALVFAVTVAWFHSNIPIPQAQPLALFVGMIPTMVVLAAGIAGWSLRANRAALLEQHLDINWLKRLSWQDFERQVAEIYRYQGYLVRETGGGGADGGVDLRLQRDGTTAIVQCKQWKTYKIGVRPVRELFGVMVSEKAYRAIFITSGIYTDEALRFAQGKSIELIDGAQLAEMLRQFQSALKHSIDPTHQTTGIPANRASGPTTAPARPKCPRCGSDMILRRAKTGQHAGREFWGCSTFATTGCRGIRTLASLNSDQ